MGDRRVDAVVVEPRQVGVYGGKILPLPARRDSRYGMGRMRCCSRSRSGREKLAWLRPWDRRGNARLGPCRHHARTHSELYSVMSMLGLGLGWWGVGRVRVRVRVGYVPGDVDVVVFTCWTITRDKVVEVKRTTQVFIGLEARAKTRPDRGLEGHEVQHVHPGVTARMATVYSLGEVPETRIHTNVGVSNLWVWVRVRVWGVGCV